MSFLKKVAGAFVELDSETQTKPSPSTKVRKSTPQNLVVSSAIHEVASSYSSGAVSDTPEYRHFVETFKNILSEENKRNFPGNDYFEFIVMKNAMAAIPAEDVKYQAAFAGWATGGNQNKAKLIETAKVYLGLVDKEIRDFETVYKQEYAQQVTKNETLIEQKTEQVRKLAEQVNQINIDITNLKNENEFNTRNLTVKHDAFTAAGQTQREEIQLEIQKINQYIN